jgi:hypothetical protein
MPRAVVLFEVLACYLWTNMERPAFGSLLGILRIGKSLDAGCRTTCVVLVMSRLLLLSHSMATQHFLTFGPEKSGEAVLHG